MTKAAAYPLKLPQSLKKTAARLAKEDGVSLNQWIATAIAQKIGAVETAASFLENRSAGADGSGLRGLLARVRDVSPLKGDELPEQFRP
jgi:hypothetical protein